MALHGKALADRRNKIESGEGFTIGNTSFDAYTFHGTGRMPEDAARQYRNFADAGMLRYTLMSYSTPIAYVLSGGTLIIPDVKYSQSTSQQLSQLRTALELLANRVQAGLIAV